MSKLQYGSVAAVLAALLIYAGCGKTDKKPADPVAVGRQVYLANCTSCHNPDPTRAGSLGPAVAGSSRELIEARVMRAGYPQGYTPKRTSHSMVPMPYLKSKLPALSAYLAAADRNADKK